MKRRTAAPFLQLSDRSIRLGNWSHTLNGNGQKPLGDILIDWDYGSNVQIYRQVSFDFEAVAEDLQLKPHEVELQVTVEVGTGPGALPRQTVEARSWSAHPEDAGVAISMSLPSDRLSSQIFLKTTVALGRDAIGLSPLSPSACGSLLWADRQTARLDGEDPRFPMEVISFASSFRGRRHDGSPWYLQWTPFGMARDFQGAVRLYLNADEKDFVQRVQDQDALTLQCLMADVISQVCECILHVEELTSELSECDPGSLGAQVHHWILRAFGSVEEAKSSLQQRPGEFRAALFSSVKV